MEEPSRPLRIYFAGDLFDSKDLGGNLLLADAIDRCSNGKYQVMLPQNGECEVKERTSQSIRDADFELLFTCDVIVANFDGTDLDSGTVVEFCFAKMLDMPAVLLRTDFRDGGDRTLPDGSPWNLMCSHYPRTENLHLNGMELYHRCKAQTTGTAELLTGYYNSIAEKIVRALDRVTAEPPWLEEHRLMEQYKATVRSIGGTLAKLLPKARLREIIDRKIANGIYRKKTV
ncbi:MAG: nucleoside 2-deoxyribosyltransferase [Lentisphaeria bacterium]|nr:nucleoside 2-deoxyribosyltransferase [Lentisphaeria bacterium]